MPVDLVLDGVERDRWASWGARVVPFIRVIGPEDSARVAVERFEAFFESLVLTDSFHVVKLLRHGLAQRCVLAEAQRLLGQPDGDRRSAGQSRQQGFGRVVEFEQANGLVDRVPSRPHRSRWLLRPEAAFAAPSARPTMGQRPGRPESGLKPRSAEWLQEHSISAGNGEVGGRARSAAHAHGPTPHAADHGQLDGFHEFDHAVGGVGNPTHQIAGADITAALLAPTQSHQRRSRLRALRR